MTLQIDHPVTQPLVLPPGLPDGTSTRRFADVAHLRTALRERSDRLGSTTNLDHLLESAYAAAAVEDQAALEAALEHVAAVATAWRDTVAARR